MSDMNIEVDLDKRIIVFSLKNDIDCKTYAIIEHIDPLQLKHAIRYAEWYNIKKSTFFTKKIEIHQVMFSAKPTLVLKFKTKESLNIVWEYISTYMLDLRILMIKIAEALEKYCSEAKNVRETMSQRVG